MTRLWSIAGVAHALGLVALPWALRGGPEAAAVVVAVLGLLTTALTRGPCGREVA